MSKNASNLYDFSTSLEIRDALRQFWLFIVDGLACMLQGEMVFWLLQLLSCHLAVVTICSKSHIGAVRKFAGIVLAQCAYHSQAGPADVCVAWVGSQAYLAMWQQLTKALVQNLLMSWRDFRFPMSLILLLRKLLGKHQLT